MNVCEYVSGLCFALVVGLGIAEKFLDVPHEIASKAVVPSGERPTIASLRTATGNPGSLLCLKPCLPSCSEVQGLGAFDGGCAGGAGKLVRYWY